MGCNIINKILILQKYYVVDRHVSLVSLWFRLGCRAVPSVVVHLYILSLSGSLSNSRRDVTITPPPPHFTSSLLPNLSFLCSTSFFSGEIFFIAYISRRCFSILFFFFFFSSILNITFLRNSTMRLANHKGPIIGIACSQERSSW